MKNDNLQERPLCLSGTGVTKVFGDVARANTAVDHVDFAFHEGELVSIVGESGSGKTTLSKMLLGLMNPTEGEIFFQGKPRDISTHARKKKYWRDIQAIFQDPFSSFNVFHKIDSVLLDCINMRGGRRLPAEKKVEMMTEACSFVNLKYAELTNKYPFELSGGQMQRLMIARIFLLKPKILLADEPTSMIDACSRATILDMLLHLRDETGMSVLIITHNMGVVAEICDYVYVMYAGKIMEQAETFELFDHTMHPYTKGLLDSIPRIGQNAERLHTIPGVVPNLLHLSQGCPFSNRCEYATDQCRTEKAQLHPVAPDHQVRCFRCEEEHQ